MQNHPQADRLSWGDSVFLNLEREGMPLNVACVCVLEGDIAGLALDPVEISGRRRPPSPG